MNSVHKNDDPHAGQAVLTGGAALISTARTAMVLLHGRGASADDILQLADDFDRPAVAYLAPQAAGDTWYPQRFLAPLAANEPFLSSALRVVAAVLQRIGEAGIPPERTLLLGFSQGACLAAEYAARNARRFGGVAVLSGGLIGPPDTARDYSGSLEGSPVFLGCSDIDPHIPRAIVAASAEVLRRLHGDVDERIYPGMGHTVNHDEIQAVQAMIDAIL